MTLQWGPNSKPYCVRPCPPGMSHYLATSPPNPAILYCGTAQVSYSQAALAQQTPCQYAPPPVPQFKVRRSISKQRQCIAGRMP